MRPQAALVVIGLALSIAACGGAGPTTPVVTPAPVDLKTALSTAFDNMPISGSASACSVSISQYGQVVLERGRGNIAPGLPASGDSLYRIASMTKPITASAILIGELAGRLHRDDKVNRYLTYPEPAPTLDELIKHAPGLPDYVTSPAYLTGYASPTTVDALLALIQPWDGVRRYQYSSSHHILLGAVLQKVNGVPYENVVERDIFGPAGMSRSSFVLPPASESFEVPSQPHPSWNYAAGGVTSTAADMNRFNQALLNNTFGFGTVESFDRSVGTTSFGMGSANTGGDLRFTHTGSLHIYSSFSVIFPSDKSSVVVMCNFASASLSNFVNAARNIMLGAK